MAFTDYTSLQAEVADYLARSNLNNKIPSFIRLFEVKMQRRLREGGNEKIVTVTPDLNGYITLPDDYQEWRSLNVQGQSGKLDFLTPDAAQDLYGSTAGVTRAFTIIGNTILVFPSTQSPMSLIYYAGIPALSAAISINWLLTKHPDLYLYGSLAEAEPFLGNDNRLALWKGLYEESLDQILTQDRSARWGKSSVYIDTAP